jgi:2-hydroxychromene-2-carboxylate isomerase
LTTHANDLNLVSPYSWFGFTNAVRFRPLLNAHGVSVDIIPFFLGGARESVGNPFTPTPKAKESFANQDSLMTGEILGLKVVRPKVFPILSLFVSFPISAMDTEAEVTNKHSQYASRRGSKTTIQQRNLTKRFQLSVQGIGAKE